MLIDSTEELSVIFSDDSGAEEEDEGFWNITQILYVENLAVPAFAEWGMMAAAAGLGPVGTVAIRRRKAKSG